MGKHRGRAPRGRPKELPQAPDIPEDETRLKFFVLKYLLVCQIEGQSSFAEKREVAILRSESISRKKKRKTKTVNKKSNMNAVSS